MDQLLVALDVDSGARALQLAEQLNGLVGGVKIGSRLFTLEGPGLVKRISGSGMRVFLDLKFHDIPNTVAQACAAATRLGVAMLNVHAGGGRPMLVAARDAVSHTAQSSGRSPPLLIAVTVLTSLSDADLRDVGVADGATVHAVRLATLARNCGLDGVVCSALEAPAMRAAFGPDFALVTPGIRPAGTTRDDQARIITPEAAVANGADYLVVGRPITQASDPVAALAAINRSIGVA